MISLDVDYDNNKSHIIPKIGSVINEIFKLFPENPTLKISYERHTDHAVERWYNRQISKLRTRGILDYVSNKGIESDGLKIELKHFLFKLKKFVKASSLQFDRKPNSKKCAYFTL